MNKAKILVADDEPFVSRILKMTLEQAGYEVISVNNGVKALASFKESQPDMVVTDVKMPQITGRKLVESIRELDGGGEVPVIVMTSTLESENRDWVAGAGNVTFLGKPVSPRELIRVIGEYFNNREQTGC